MGVRNDIEEVPGILEKKEKIPVRDVIEGLPRLRGGLSRIGLDNVESRAFFVVSRKL